jgi:hypothetical protein
MMLSADELRGKVHIPLTPASRVHIMPDEDDAPTADERPLSDRVLEWCRTSGVAITMETICVQFDILPGQATTYLQRFHRRGFLRRSHKIPGGNNRPMQVWKWYRV